MWAKLQDVIQAPPYKFFPHQICATLDQIFLVRLYNSQCRVLTFPTTSFYLPLSWTRDLQCDTFNLCVSFLTSSSQRIFGLPFGLFEMGFQACIALTILYLAFFQYDHTIIAFALWRSLLCSHVLLVYTIPCSFLFSRIHFHRLRQIFSSIFSFQKPLVYWLLFLL